MCKWNSNTAPQISYHADQQPLKSPKVYIHSFLLWYAWSLHFKQDINSNALWELYHWNFHSCPRHTWWSQLTWQERMCCLILQSALFHPITPAFNNQMMSRKTRDGNMSTPLEHDDTELASQRVIIDPFQSALKHAWFYCFTLQSFTGCKCCVLYTWNPRMDTNNLYCIQKSMSP